MSRKIVKHTLTLAALMSIALVGLTPSVAAEEAPPEFAVLCNPEPLGPPGGGAVGQVKSAGNTIIYTGCELVIGIAGPVIVIALTAAGLVIDLAVGAAGLALEVVNAVCIFLTGQPCVILDGREF